MSDSFDPYQQWLGIQPHEHPVDHYRLLGLPRYCSDQELIRSATDGRMGYVRTFQTGRHAAHTQQLLNKLSAAKLCLLDPHTRATYNAVLEGQMSAEPQPAAAAGLPPASDRPAVRMVKQSVQLPHVTDSEPATGDGGKPGPYGPSTEQHHGRQRARPWHLGVVAGGLFLAVALIWGFSQIVSQSVSSTADPPSHGHENSLLEENPPVDQTVLIHQESNGVINLPAAVATTRGPYIEVATRGGELVLVHWESIADSATWDFHVVSLPRQGIFKVEITYAGDEDADGSRFTLAVGESSITKTARNTGGLDQFTTEHIGYLALRRNGRHQLSATAAAKPLDQVMVLRSIRLIPRGM